MALESKEAIKQRLAAMRSRLEAAGEERPEIALVFRSMFGGIGVYSAGQMVASLSDRGLALKLPADQQELLLQEPGSERLQHEPTSPVSRHYIIVPETFLSDNELLQPWFEKSIDYVKTLPVKKRKSAGAKRSGEVVE